MNDNQKSLLSFVVGAAAGLAAGMLLAPYSGEDSRRRIASRANDLRNKVGGQLGDTLDKLSSFTDSTLANLTGNKGGAAGNKGTTGTTGAAGTTGSTNRTDF